MRIPFEEITHTTQKPHWLYLRHIHVTPAVQPKKKLSDKYQVGNPWYFGVLDIAFMHPILKS